MYGQRLQARVLDSIPADYPVRPLGSDEPADDPVQCGTCGLSWDDAVVTGLTPAPSARCPFEPFHLDEPVGDCTFCGELLFTGDRVRRHLPTGRAIHEACHDERTRSRSYKPGFYAAIPETL